MFKSPYSNWVTDNLMKYHCLMCNGEFIINEEKEETIKTIHCPYCQSFCTELVATLDDNDLLDQLGCVSIGYEGGK